MHRLQLERLDKAFGERVLFRALSFAVGAGGLAVITGPSGAGKTTLLRLIAGLDTPQAGAIHVHGREATRGARVLVAPHRRGLGLTFQEPALWPHMRVAQHVAWTLAARGIPRRQRSTRAAALLADLELAPFAQAYPATLSGGQQQRVNLARAFAGDPPLLLLDEPLSHLDAALALRVRTMIAARLAAGAAVVVAAHEAEGWATLTASPVEIRLPLL